MDFEKSMHLFFVTAAVAISRRSASMMNSRTHKHTAAWLIRKKELKMSAELVITTFHTALNLVGLALALAAAGAGASLIRSIVREK